AQAWPASTTSFVTVVLLAPVSWVTARMLLPSHRRWRMRARCSLVSLFILTFIRESKTNGNENPLGFVFSLLDSAVAVVYNRKHREVAVPVFALSTAK